MSHRKGSRTERELVTKLKESGFQAIRIAGSGKMDNAPDIISGKPGRLLIIECKSSKKAQIYINPIEISNVLDYARKFGGEAWYAIRFNHKPWQFIPASSVMKQRKISPNDGISFEKFTNKDT